MIGCGQLKPHGDDILELASIAVNEKYRGMGVARAIIEHLLKDSPRPLYLTCQASNRGLYEKFGFRVLDYEDMPRYFQRLSRIAGFIIKLARQNQRGFVMKLQ